MAYKTGIFGLDLGKWNIGRAPWVSVSVTSSLAIATLIAAANQSWKFAIGSGLMTLIGIIVSVILYIREHDKAVAPTTQYEK